MKDFIFNQIFFLFVILFQNYSKVFSLPKSLKDLKVLYTSPFEISSEKPIMTLNNVFFVSNNKIKSIDLEKVLSKKKQNESTEIFGDVYKNPLAYAITYKGLSFFCSKGNQLEMWEENLMNQFDESPIFEGKFTQFNCEEHNDSLKIGFCLQNGKKENYEVEIYSKWSKKVTVLDIEEVDKHVTKEDILADMEMESNVAQSFIYYIYDYGRKNKTKLIVVDQQGDIKIWNIGVFTEKYSKGYSRCVNPLSKSVKLNETCPELTYNQDIAGLIGENKNILLYLGKENFYLIHLEKGLYYMELVKIKNSIKDPLSVLVLDDGDVLIGTKDGYIYLIEYVYEPHSKKINILDKYNICKDSPVKHISYDTSCPKNSEKCYTFAVNCGNLKIFKIPSNESVLGEYKWIVIFIIIFSFIIFLVCLYKNIIKSKSDKEKKDEEIELTEH